MKKKLLIGLGGFASVVLVLGLVAPKEFACEREITINKPKDVVFSYVKSLKNQDNWSTWSLKDPNMTKEFKGTDGAVGAVSSWNGNSEVGSGEQEVKKILEGERVEFELRFKKPFEATNSAFLATEAVGAAATKVKWGFSGKTSFPMNIMHLFMNMDQMIGKEFEAGLGNLKAILEKS
jgi:hypothetical protein